MLNKTVLEEFKQILKSLPSRDGLLNPYNSTSGSFAEDSGEEISDLADEIRLENLVTFLTNISEKGGRALLCGEAPGYQGCRFSGVAFTSEREVLAGLHPELTGCQVLPEVARGQRHPMKEPSGQAVWEAMRRTERPFFLWNSVQLHPHKEGQSLTNRTPKKAEVELGRQSFGKLLELISPSRIVAIGRTAEKALQDWGYSIDIVRHPAYGGKPDFLKGLESMGVIGPESDPQLGLL